MYIHFKLRLQGLKSLQNLIFDRYKLDLANMFLQQETFHEQKKVLALRHISDFFSKRFSFFDKKIKMKLELCS